MTDNVRNSAIMTAGMKLLREKGQNIVKKFFIPVLLCLFLLNACGKNLNYIVSYMPYEEIPEDYSLANAKADGLVVYENSDITFGQFFWDEFIENTAKGIPCAVRLAFYYNIDSEKLNPELYEGSKEDQPKLIIQDLGFNGKIYTLFFREEGKKYTYKYNYLLKFKELHPKGKYIEYIHYALVNNDSITWEEIKNDADSPLMGGEMDYKIVYSKHIPPEALSLEEQYEIMRDIGIADWQIQPLGNWGLTFAEILELSQERLNEIFAPGTLGDGADPYHELDEKQQHELINRGHTIEELEVLFVLGFNSEEIENLTQKQKEFIFPNTELIDKLVAIGYKKEQIVSLGHLRQAGWDSYRDLLMEVFASMDIDK